jgi:hypothetical protein
MTENWREENNDKINNYISDLADVWDTSNYPTNIKLTEFVKYVPKNSLMQFISRYELYKIIQNIPGDIIELGVCGGKGLFSFIQSVFINEPQYQWRNIIGFDTFNGFVSLSEHDNLNIDSHLKKEGAFKENSYDELCKLSKIHQDFRFMNTRNQIEIIKGDIKYTIPEFITKNKGLIISLLYLDLDLYEPTKIAIELLWDRIPKGGIIVFDEAITRTWQGEAQALHEIIGIGNCELKIIPNLKQFYLLKK